jgi:hypothetical protein
LKAVFPTLWHGFPAWTLESRAVKVVVLPQQGAKIVSLFDKRVGYEWLVGPMRPLRSLSGWDEMFPTINACQYPGTGVYSGRALPDHGEVWSLPWGLESQDGATLVLGVEGRALPYRLLRSATLAKPDLLRLEYRLLNTGPQPFDYLWAAHPQFAAGADTEIIMSQEVTQVINVLPGAVWGEVGVCYSWPSTETLDGRGWRLDRVRSPECGECRKFYLPPDAPAAWGGLSNHQANCSLKIEWSTVELPYLGIWVDEGAYNSASVVALEPSNGYYDSLVTAANNQRLSRINPGDEHRWSLLVRLFDGLLDATGGDI